MSSPPEGLEALKAVVARERGHTYGHQGLASQERLDAWTHALEATGVQDRDYIMSAIEVIAHSHGLICAYALDADGRKVAVGTKNSEVAEAASLPLSDSE